MANLTAEDIYNSPYMNGKRLSADIGSLMVLAPHPDDESLGCGGLIAMLREQGTPVTVVFITSGSASHSKSKTHPPKVLSKIRETEAENACAELGVSKDAIHFLRRPDGQLDKMDDTELSDLTTALSKIFLDTEIAALAVPWRRDAHPDHRVVHMLGNTILDGLESKAVKIEYPIWLWKNGKGEDWPTVGESAPYRLDISTVFDKKRKAVQCHKSQLGHLVHDDPNGFVLTEELLEPFNTDSEYFFVTGQNNLKTLDGDYFDKLYSEQSDPWNFRNSPYEHGKYRKCMSALGHESFVSALELGCSIGMQTEMLAEKCSRLIAVDISESAVETASRTCNGLDHIEFKVMDVTKDYPYGEYDLVTCCEMGYYLEASDLHRLFDSIVKSLVPGGILLMVHWTPFVPDYPQTGDAVHDTFEERNAETQLFEELVNERHDHYRLQVWRKSNSVVPR